MENMNNEQNTFEERIRAYSEYQNLKYTHHTSRRASTKNVFHTVAETKITLKKLKNMRNEPQKKVLNEVPNKKLKEPQASSMEPSRMNDEHSRDEQKHNKYSVVGKGSPLQNFGFMLIFDTETTSDTAQELRFGTYQVRGTGHHSLKRLHERGENIDELTDAIVVRKDGIQECGFFYGNNVTDDELQIMKNYCEKNHLRLLSLEEFIKIFFLYCYRLEGAVLCHNLPFDISRIANAWYPARGDFQGGFSFKLCTCTGYPKRKVVTTLPENDTEHRDENDDNDEDDVEYTNYCPIHPRVKIVKLSPHKHLVEFSKLHGEKNFKGIFIDTIMLAKSYLGASASVSMESLARLFHLPPKLESEYSGSINDKELEYAYHDVELTFEIYKKLRELHRLDDVPVQLQHVYSGASRAKALLRKIGVPDWYDIKEKIDANIFGIAMSTYFGGRSEVHVRHTPLEGQLFDFHSQYPSVHSLLRLQDMMYSDSFERVDRTSDVQALFQSWHSVDDALAWLHSRDNWQRLRVLVQVKRHQEDFYPTRLSFGNQTTIAYAHLEHEDNTHLSWYTLSDVIASFLQTGVTPDIRAAFEMCPTNIRIPEKLVLFKDGEHPVEIDFAQDNLFMRLVAARDALKRDISAIKKHAKAEQRELSSDEAATIDRLTLQANALKEWANSGSYGILVQTVVKQDEYINELDVYSNGEKCTCFNLFHDMYGRFYNPLIATHIPAGGRLLLACAFALIKREELTYGFCDTDSVFIGNNHGESYTLADDHYNQYVVLHPYERQTFLDKCERIRSWFNALSPYDAGVQFLASEDVNQWQGQAEPLYFLGIAAKRYVLYNKCQDGTFRIRKASAHGAGVWAIPPSRYKTYRDDIPSCPSPQDLMSIMHVGSHGMHMYDIWYYYIDTIETYHHAPPTLADVAPYPATMQVTISSSYLLRTYSEIAGLRPYNFFRLYPPRRRSQYLNTMNKQARLFAPKFHRLGETDEDTEVLDTRQMKARYSAFIRDDEVQDVMELYEIGQGDRKFTTRLATIDQCMSDYYSHPEMKARNGENEGFMLAQQGILVDTRAQSKEIHELFNAEPEYTNSHADDVDTLVNALVNREYTQPAIDALLSGEIPTSVYVSFGMNSDRVQKLRRKEFTTVRATREELDIIIQVYHAREQWHEMREKIRERGIGKIAQLSQIPRPTLSNTLSNSYPPTYSIFEKLLETVKELDRR